MLLCNVFGNIWKVIIKYINKQVVIKGWIYAYIYIYNYYCFLLTNNLATKTYIYTYIYLIFIMGMLQYKSAAHLNNILTD